MSNNKLGFGSGPQQWMSQPDHGPEPFNYQVSRPSNSVQHNSNSYSQQTPLNQQMPPIRREEESASPPPGDFDRNLKGGNRAVIPSKRAAQNRAAQKAFRQRREQYIKDLEIKAKEMEDWQDEMDKLKKENSELRERVLSLEHQVTMLTGNDLNTTQPSSEENQPREVSTIENHSIPAPAPSLPPPPPISQSLPHSQSTIKLTNEVNVLVENISSSVKRSHNESRLRHEQYELNEPKQQEGSFVPMPLRTQNQTGFKSTSYHPNDRTTSLTSNNPTISDSKRRKLNDTSLMTQSTFHQTPIVTNTTTNINPTTTNSHNNATDMLMPIQQQNTNQGFWNNNNNQNNTGDFDLDFDFDPFFEEEFGPTINSSNDFLPNANSGQVLDDLFAMLQTRQRPQIPIIPTTEATNEFNPINHHDSLM